MILSGGLPVNRHSKPHGPSIITRAEHKMQVAGVETKDDLSSSGIQDCNLFVNDPIARKPPVVQ